MPPNTKIIYSVTRHNGRDHWQQIGIAVVNPDGSENLVFDTLPTDPQATIQIREAKTERERGDDADGGA